MVLCCLLLSRWVRVGYSPAARERLRRRLFEADPREFVSVASESASRTEHIDLFAEVECVVVGEGRHVRDAEAAFFSRDVLQLLLESVFDFRTAFADLSLGGAVELEI